MFNSVTKRNPLAINTLIAFCALFFLSGCSHNDEDTIFVSASVTLKPPLLEITELYLKQPLQQISSSISVAQAF